MTGGLTPRQKQILSGIIEVHIETRGPVGSRTLADRYPWSTSPASLRHEMGILEEGGYLTHPHPSAGRMPTDQGYQFYVNHIVKEEPVSSDALQRMAREMTGEIRNLEFLMERASRILSTIAEEIVVATAPRSLPDWERQQVFIGGSRYILQQPEFRDVEKLEHLMTLLEEKSCVLDLLKPQNSETGVHVAIGEKELRKEIWDCALVSAPYFCRGKTLGSLGILGPRRMPYGRIMGLVHQMAGEVGRRLDRWGADG